MDPKAKKKRVSVSSLEPLARRSSTASAASKARNISSDTHQPQQQQQTPYHPPQHRLVSEGSPSSRPSPAKPSPQRSTPSRFEPPVTLKTQQKSKPWVTSAELAAKERQAQRSSEHEGTKAVTTTQQQSHTITELDQKEVPTLVLEGPSPEAEVPTHTTAIDSYAHATAAIQAVADNTPLTLVQTIDPNTLAAYHEQVSQNVSAEHRAALGLSSIKEEDSRHTTTTRPAVMSGRRKIWVKRPGAAATLVTINEDDVVDDVKDMILRKYANSLGRNFDSPDVTLRIEPRDQTTALAKPQANALLVTRVLSPEEPIGKVIDQSYPGGQAVEDALIIDVPSRKTPRHSPYHQYAPNHLLAETYARPSEQHGGEYFPQMPPRASPGTTQQLVPSMTVLTTGQVPALPSPGIRRQHRPASTRRTTTSPVQTGNSNAHAERSAQVAGVSQMRSLPTPPAPTVHTSSSADTPPQGPRPPSPRPPRTVARKPTAKKPEPGPAKGPIPPIKILLVEDNSISMRILEAFMKKLKVRYTGAVNGKQAVDKWREGGFHLIFMDIQLPVMNGLQATREIRRLERVNHIGRGDEDGSPDDILQNRDEFKSSVIIVALTASALPSDRHEALAAGCNDFLTKPVDLKGLEVKVMEWGCMQALIDFEGWRQWKYASATATTSKTISPQRTALRGALKKDKKEGSPTSTATDRVSSESLPDKQAETGAKESEEGIAKATNKESDSSSGSSDTAATTGGTSLPNRKAPSSASSQRLRNTTPLRSSHIPDSQTTDPIKSQIEAEQVADGSNTATVRRSRKSQVNFSGLDGVQEEDFASTNGA